MGRKKVKHFHFPSKTRDGLEHIVTASSRYIYCSCDHKIHRKSDCSHVTNVKTGSSVPPQETYFFDDEEPFTLQKIPHDGVVVGMIKGIPHIFILSADKDVYVKRFQDMRSFVFQRMFVSSSLVSTTTADFHSVYSLIPPQDSEDPSRHMVKLLETIICPDIINDVFQNLDKKGYNKVGVYFDPIARHMLRNREEIYMTDQEALRRLHRLPLIELQKYLVTALTHNRASVLYARKKGRINYSVAQLWALGRILANEKHRKSEATLVRTALKDLKAIKNFKPYAREAANDTLYRQTVEERIGGLPASYWTPTTKNEAHFVLIELYKRKQVLRNLGIVMAEYDQKDTKKELTAILEMPDYQESVEMLRRDIKIISEKAGKQPQDVEFMLRGNGVKRNILVGNFGRTFLQLCYKELDKELDERIKHLPAYLHEVIYKIAAWRKVMPHALSKPEEGHVQAAQTR